MGVKFLHSTGSYLVLVCLIGCTASTKQTSLNSPAPANLQRLSLQLELGNHVSEEIPLIDGTGIHLEKLTGKIVVLELSGSWLPSWGQSYQLYNDLLAVYGPEQIAVVVVSLDPSIEQLHPEPTVRVRGFELGWDPQGALAAKWQLSNLPMVLILDGAGRINFINQGEFKPDLIREAIQKLFPHSTF